MFKNLFFIFSLIPKKKIIFLFFLISIFTFLESIGIGLVFPLLLSIIEGDNLEKFHLLLAIQNFFNFSSIIILILTLTVSAFFLKFIVSLIFSYYQSNEIYNFEQTVSNLTLEDFLNQTFKKISLVNTSEIINNTITQCSIVSEYVIKNIFGLVADTILIFGILLILFIVSPELSLLSIIYCVIIILSVNIIIRKKLRQLGQEKQIIDKNKLQSIQETFSIIRNIKLLSLEKFFFENFQNENTKYKNILAKEFFISTIPRFFIELSSVLLFVFILFYYNLKNENLVSIIPSIALIGAAGARLIPALSRLQFYFVQIRFGLPVIEKIKEKYDDYVNFKLDDIKNSEKDEIKENELNFENMKIKNLSFKYFKKDEKYIVKNLNAELFKGDIVGIKGKSGSGKTTLIDIISGLLNPTSGDIFIDNFNVSKSNLKKSWMKFIGYVPQEIFLVDSTIEENLMLFNKNLNLKDNHIGFLDFINQLPNGFKTRVGENGNLLSGGQKQRIGIARILLNKPKILILDESTNALDAKNENLILNEIKKYRNQYITFIISHNSETLNFCNKFIKLEN